LEHGVHHGLAARVRAVGEEIAIRADDGKWLVADYKAIPLGADEALKRHDIS
jgi:hypothetical protein